MPNKKVKLRLVGQDGNSFNLMGLFKAQAKAEGWTQEEIKSVLDECTTGDYDHLLQTLISVCEDPEDDETEGETGLEPDIEEED